MHLTIAMREQDLSKWRFLVFYASPDFKLFMCYVLSCATCKFRHTHLTEVPKDTSICARSTTRRWQCGLTQATSHCGSLFILLTTHMEKGPSKHDVDEEEKQREACSQGYAIYITKRTIFPLLLKI